MTLAVFVPQVRGRDLKITTIQGAEGRPYRIAFAGMRPEPGTDYFYDDEYARFWFYAECKFQPVTCWDVKGASQHKGSAYNFKSNPENARVFQQNIEHFFQTRNWSEPWLPGDDSSAGVPVIFTWSIVQ